MKYIYLIIPIFFIQTLAYSQKAYLKKDSISSIGIVLLEGSSKQNSSYCKVKKGEKEIKYSPYEVNEYGFANGRKYYAKTIETKDSIRRVFLELIYHNKTKLYYYKGSKEKLFFIEEDSTKLTKIEKQSAEYTSYKQHLAQITQDCSYANNTSKVVHFNKHAFARFFDQFDKCKRLPFPFFKYGIMAGYNNAALSLSTHAKDDDELNQFNYYNNKSFSIGLFMDQPLFASDFSLHIETFLTKHAFPLNESIRNKEYHLLSDLTSITAPVLFRYALPTNIVRPYFELGFSGVYHVVNKSKLFSATINNNTIRMDVIEEINPINNVQLGYAFGAGLEFKLTTKHSVFLHISHAKHYGLNDSNLLNLSGTNISIAFNI